MSTKEKLEYARLRMQGAAMFAQDKEESLRWKKHVEEIEQQLVKESSQ